MTRPCRAPSCSKPPVASRCLHVTFGDVVYDGAHIAEHQLKSKKFFQISPWAYLGRRSSVTLGRASLKTSTTWDLSMFVSATAGVVSGRYGANGNKR